MKKEKKMKSRNQPDRDQTIVKIGKVKSVPLLKPTKLNVPEQFMYYFGEKFKKCLKIC